MSVDNKLVLRWCNAHRITPFTLDGAAAYILLYGGHSDKPVASTTICHKITASDLNRRDAASRLGSWFRMPAAVFVDRVLRWSDGR